MVLGRGGTLKIAIVGSREYPHPEEVRDYVNGLEEGDEVISGAARGVDSWAAKAARERGLKVTEYPARWAEFGKSAGFIRNRTIVLAADKVVAFWDGKSKGTKNSMALAKFFVKPLEVFTAC